MLLDQAKHARNGLPKLHKSTVELQRSSQMVDLEITTFAEILMVSQRPSGAIPPIQKRDGSIATLLLKRKRKSQNLVQRNAQVKNVLDIEENKIRPYLEKLV
jgi:hypothetical protein